MVMLENCYRQNKRALIQFHRLVVLDYYRKQQTSKMNIFRKTNCLPLAYTGKFNLDKALRLLLLTNYDLNSQPET